ncbi:amino acid racemase [Lachnospiraceae bacterium OttesenSCG-928-J05]|nr:amino acid racemase [Lachnospiraceae bacterium OttesenSCG-928-J05]
MEKKLLGVIGGMGPEATDYYYNQVIAHTDAPKDQDHIDMVILSHASMPDRTQAILSGDDQDIIKKLAKDAQTLEAMGVSNIAIPCNTSHYFYEKIQAETKATIINMVEESVKFAVNNFEDVHKIGIMATDGTVKARVYHQACEALGVEAMIPSEKRQVEVMSLIYEEIKAGLPGDKKKFNRIYEELVKNGCDVVILACTELSVYKKSHEVSERCLDAMDVLVRESIIRSGAEYKE